MTKIESYRRWLKMLASLDEPVLVESQAFKDQCSNCGGEAVETLDNSNGNALEQAFTEFLSSHPEHRAALRKQLIQEALQQVDLAMEQYRRIKAQRPLTDEEKEVGPVLLELLSAARRLLHTE